MLRTASDAETFSTKHTLLLHNSQNSGSLLSRLNKMLRCLVLSVWYVARLRRAPPLPIGRHQCSTFHFLPNCTMRCQAVLWRGRETVFRLWNRSGAFGEEGKIEREPRTLIVKLEHLLLSSWKHIIHHPYPQSHPSQAPQPSSHTLAQQIPNLTMRCQAVLWRGRETVFRLWNRSGAFGVEREIEREPRTLMVKLEHLLLSSWTYIIHHPYPQSHPSQAPQPSSHTLAQ
ncbi:hypothetical protein EDB19DRAFT_1696827 [Suillus lakei]|nr:hypothetical protein EDB19DRAFT_1696827 [Suillus lakei]